MKTNRFDSTLKLSYSPISNREFYYLKQEDKVKKLLESSSLYVIAQRQELFFEITAFDSSTNTLSFNIIKNDCDNVLRGVINLQQNQIIPYNIENFEIRFETVEDEGEIPFELPITNIKSMRLFSDDAENKFLIWLTPDKLLYHYFNGHIETEIEGDLEEFISFNVHYIGESTDQNILKRLTGHEKLQDVLTIERSLSKKSFISDEVILLLFHIEEANNLIIGSDFSNFMQLLYPNQFPTTRTIVLDAEKALIKALQPSKKYNKIQYKSYPKSANGLYKNNYDLITYFIKEKLNLKYDNRTIKGDFEIQNSTKIRIQNNKKLHLEN